MNIENEFEQALETLVTRFSKAAKACVIHVKDEPKQKQVLQNLNLAYQSFLNTVPLIEQDATGNCPRGTHPCGDYCCPDLVSLTEAQLCSTCKSLIAHKLFEAFVSKL